MTQQGANTSDARARRRGAWAAMERWLGKPRSADLQRIDYSIQNAERMTHGDSGAPPPTRFVVDGEISLEEALMRSASAECDGEASDEQFVFEIGSDVGVRKIDRYAKIEWDSIFRDGSTT